MTPGGDLFNRSSEATEFTLVGARSLKVKPRRQISLPQPLPFLNLLYTAKDWVSLVLAGLCEIWQVLGCCYTFVCNDKSPSLPLPIESQYRTLALNWCWWAPKLKAAWLTGDVSVIQHGVNTSLQFVDLTACGYHMAVIFQTHTHTQTHIYVYIYIMEGSTQYSLNIRLLQKMHSKSFFSDIHLLKYFSKAYDSED